MSKLEICQERESMDGADSPINFEQQVCNWFSWKDITNHELCYNVISRLLQGKTHVNISTLMTSHFASKWSVIMKDDERVETAGILN